jgi:RecA/RadA recombinase
MAAVALGRDFEFKVDRPEVCPTGVAEVDAMAGGLPQGCLTEVYGPASSGRTSLMLASMAQSTSRENVSALVDTNGAFDPASAAAAGVRLERGVGLIVMDPTDEPAVSARCISTTSWFRLRRAAAGLPHQA